MYKEQDILSLDDGRITEVGVAVIEVTRMPVYNTPYVSPHYIISLCHSGSVDVEYDFNPAQFHPGDLAIVYPQHTLMAYSSSPDYRATLIVISADIYAKIGKINLGHKRLVYEHLPHFHLSDDQYDAMLSFINTLHHILRLDMKSHEDILIFCIHILSQIVDHFHDTAVGPTSAEVRQLSYRFHNAVIENCQQHRDVQFYADLFCLSSKHFSSVVKQQTGYTAGYWIQHFLIIRAKQMLSFEPDITIQTIADRFNFPDQASFCRYFKRGTGLSPTQYRTGG